MPTTPPGLRIDVDGSVTVLDGASLDELQAAVGGLIQAIPTDESLIIWVNEEGKVDGLPLNPLGHQLWSLFDVAGCIEAGDWLAGPCAITGPADLAGEVTPVPPWVMPLVIGLAATMSRPTT